MITTKENQNIELKSNWHNEYLKWICGFANAQGGSLYIGVDDHGTVVGLNNAHKLSEDIPNKVRDILGIMVTVEVKHNNEKDYIKIVTDAYPNPISYKGHYYVRSGSTNQEITGNTLNKFLLERYGKTWDSVAVPQLTVADLDDNSFSLFRDLALYSERVDSKVIKDTNETILKNLELLSGNNLTRATILLFHAHPEKFFTGAFIKLGYFETADELRFQDEIYGSLFVQVQKTLELLKNKYLKAEIRYEHASRVEEFSFPEAAFREALLNAVAHKDYTSTAPIQIRVYENRITFWNQGELPDNWTADKLVEEHPSLPYNPAISRALFRSGYIEAWGRGTLKMIYECRKRNLPSPLYKADFSGLIVEFRKYTEEYLLSLGLNKRQIKAVFFTRDNKKITNKDYQRINNCARNTASKELIELVKKDVLVSSEKKGLGSYYML